MPLLSRPLVRYGYVPLMLLGVNGVAVVLAGTGAAKTWLVTLVVAAVAMSFAAERLLPYEPNWNGSAGDAGRDVVHAVVNELLVLAGNQHRPS